MKEYLFALIVLLFAIPIGYGLKAVTKEELKVGRKYFKILWVGSLVLSFIFLFLGEIYIVFSLIFIAIVSYISWK